MMMLLSLVLVSTYPVGKSAHELRERDQTVRVPVHFFPPILRYHVRALFEVVWSVLADDVHDLVERNPSVAILVEAQVRVDDQFERLFEGHFLRQRRVRGETPL